MILPNVPTSLLAPFGSRFICYGCRVIGIGDSLEEAYASWYRMLMFHVEHRA